MEVIEAPPDLVSKGMAMAASTGMRVLAVPPRRDNGHTTLGLHVVADEVGIMASLGQRDLEAASPTVRSMRGVGTTGESATGNRNSSVAPPLDARPGNPEYAVERFHGNPTVVYYWRIARPPYSWHCSARKNKRSRPRDSRGGEAGSDRTRIPKSEKDLRRSPSRPGQRPLSRSGRL